MTETLTPKTGNREPQQNYRLGTVSNELLRGGGLKLVLRAHPHPQFLKWYKTISWLFGSHRVYTVCILVFLRTSVSEILSCHSILRVFSDNLSGNVQVSWHGVGILSRPHMNVRRLTVPQPCRLLAKRQV